MLLHLVSVLALAAPQDADNDARIRALEERIVAQEEELRALRRELEALRSARTMGGVAPAGAPAEPQEGGERQDGMRVRWDDGLRFEAANGSFTLRFNGRIQADAVFWTDDEDGSLLPRVEDQVGFRRTRFDLSGSLWKRFVFKAGYDFADDGTGKFQDVYVGVTDLPIVGTLIVGHKKEPYALEQLTDDRFVTFVERSLVDSAFAPVRSPGVHLGGPLAEQRVTWGLAVVRPGDAFGESDAAQGSGYAITGRLTWLPWYEEEGRRLLHLGAAYSHRETQGGTLRFRARPEVRPVPVFSDTGSFRAHDADMLGLEAALVLGPFSAQGEYSRVWVDRDGASDPVFDGFYVQASWLLTGEHRRYDRTSGVFGRVIPAHRAFDGEGHAGAWELAVRYSQVDLDDGGLRGEQVRDWTFGVNWYPFSHGRVSANYVLTDVDDAGDAAAFVLRFQIDF
jgi:phosphate-selective porin OprO/OprP